MTYPAWAPKGIRLNPKERGDVLPANRMWFPRSCHADYRVNPGPAAGLGEPAEDVRAEDPSAQER